MNINSNQMTQDFQNLDRQIENLMKCKPLPENDVKMLTDKVEIFYKTFIKTIKIKFFY